MTNSIGRNILCRFPENKTWPNWQNSSIDEIDVDQVIFVGIKRKAAVLTNAIKMYLLFAVYLLYRCVMTSTWHRFIVYLIRITNITNLCALKCILNIHVYLQLFVMYSFKPAICGIQWFFVLFFVKLSILYNIRLIRFYISSVLSLGCKFVFEISLNILYLISLKFRPCPYVSIICLVQASKSTSLKI